MRKKTILVLCVSYYSNEQTLNVLKQKVKWCALFSLFLLFYGLVLAVSDEYNNNTNNIYFFYCVFCVCASVAILSKREVFKDDR